ncbi:hypothetical protein [Microbacterium sp. MMO-10]|uniref:hypothetical protein n=1 Tax=Microbacterium sp. MMO-10 TaxID=3081272 RepID=UPI003019BF36
MVESDETLLEAILARFDEGWAEAIDVGPGWYSLLVRLDQQLSEIDPNYRVQQVKSKFGALSFYARSSSEPDEFNEVFHQTIRSAEWESAEMCEECGAPARTYAIRLWVSTLCEEHAKVKREEPDER